jgi:hypothetical protein
MTKMRNFIRALLTTNDGFHPREWIGFLPLFGFTVPWLDEAYSRRSKMRHKVMFLITGVPPVLAHSALDAGLAVGFMEGPYKVDVFMGGKLLTRYLHTHDPSADRTHRRQIQSNTWSGCALVYVGNQYTEGAGLGMYHDDKAMRRNTASKRPEERPHQAITVWRSESITSLGRGLTYFDFFSSLAFLFSLMVFAGFFLTSFLASLGFVITYLFLN